MPDEFTPEEQKILAESPADSPVLMDDDEDGEGAPGGTESGPTS
jgi:hypothetical protein